MGAGGGGLEARNLFRRLGANLAWRCFLDEYMIGGNNGSEGDKPLR